MASLNFITQLIRNHDNSKPIIKCYLDWRPPFSLRQGGLPLAAFGTHKRVMDLISDHKVFHGGTYNTNPISMAAGIATLDLLAAPGVWDRAERWAARATDIGEVV